MKKTIETASMTTLVTQLARLVYADILATRMVETLDGPVAETEHLSNGVVRLRFSPGLVDGHGHTVPGFTIDTLPGPALGALGSSIRAAAESAIAGWDYWQHGGDRRARVVRALKRMDNQPKWVSEHRGCPDHTRWHP